MRCPTCHSEVPDTSKFCPECGTDLRAGGEKPAAPEAEPTATPEGPAEQPAEPAARRTDGSPWHAFLVWAQLPLTALALLASAAGCLLDATGASGAGIAGAALDGLRVADYAFCAVFVALAVACVVVRQGLAARRRTAPRRCLALLGLDIAAHCLYAFVLSLVFRVEVADVMPPLSLAQIIWCLVFVLANKFYFPARADLYAR